MNWNKMSLLKKIAGTIMAITVVSTVVLSYIQYRLYTNNFETIFSNLEDSVITMKRNSARDILREVKIATQGSLAQGEYDVFTNFAKKQKEIGEIQAFSFYGKTGKVELSSASSRINEAIASELWNQAEKTNETFLKEQTGASRSIIRCTWTTICAACTRRGKSANYTACSASSSPRTRSMRCPRPRSNYTAASWRVSCVVVCPWAWHCASLSDWHC